MDGFASGGNGYPHTEQRFTLPSQAQCGGSSVFFIAMPAVYAVRAAVQGLWKSNCITTGNSPSLTAKMSFLTIGEGDIQASDRVELFRSASFTGGISTARISIEEGAFFKGKRDGMLWITKERCL
jgi:hypothetical protein